MDLERPSTGKVSERPLTRWRRDQEDDVESRSRIERPSSRRGSKIDSQDVISSSGYRSATPSRSVVGRPPSASAFSNRVLSAAATPVSSVSGGSFSNYGQVSGRLGTGLPPATQVNILDRPITQQGIAGVRLGTNRGLPMTRQVQDRRYYEGLLQLKIRELTQEISAISRQIDNQNRERATWLHYDNRAKELAQELTDLQGQLADYNLVVEKMTLNPDIESIQSEAAELAMKNDESLAEIEDLFVQRQEQEEALRRADSDIEKERKKADEIVNEMDPELRTKYDELMSRKTDLQTMIADMQNELDNLLGEKEHMEEQIALSQVKQEAVKLLVKISEMESKRDKLQREEKNKMTPEEEQVHLLAKLKQDNAEVTAAERQIIDLKQQISDAERELEQLETDLEDSQSARHVKYKEMRKREEAMEQFMATFDRCKQEELEKLEKLESAIVEHLTQISGWVTSDPSLAAGDEMAILNMPQSDNGESDPVSDKDRTIEGLTEEHYRLQQHYVKLQTLEKKLTAEFSELQEKIQKEQSELIVLEDLDGLKARFEVKKEELLAERERLRERLPLSNQELSRVQEEYQELKSRLDSNETYLQITSLEEKLEKLKENSAKIENFLKEQRDRFDYVGIKNRALELVEQYNNVLKENSKSIY